MDEPTSRFGCAACTACLQGRYGFAIDARTDADCLSCPAGKFQPSPGSEMCTDCSPGRSVICHSWLVLFRSSIVYSVLVATACKM